MSVSDDAIFLDQYLYGNGIFLDEDFDFDVDETGDIRASKGTDELEKDLAFQMAIALDPIIGQPPSQSTEAKLINRATAVALSDNRIESVDEDNVEVREIELSRRDVEYEITLPISSSQTVQELVFVI